MLNFFRQMLIDPSKLKHSQLSKHFESNPIQYCEELAQAIRSDSVEFNVTWLMAVQLSKKLALICKRNYHQHKNWLIYFHQNIIADSTISHKVKHSFRDSFKELIYCLQAEKREKEYVESPEFEWLKEFILRTVTHQQDNISMVSIALLEAVQQVDYNDYMKHFIYRQIMSEFVLLGVRIHEKIRERVEEAQEFITKIPQPEQNQRSRQCFKEFSSQLGQLTQWMECCSQIVELLIHMCQINKRLHMDVYVLLANNIPLQSILKGILGLVVNSPRQKQNLLFSTNGLLCDQALNDLKAQALKTHEKIILGLPLIEHKQQQMTGRIMFSEVIKLVPALFESFTVLKKTPESIQSTQSQLYGKNILRLNIAYYHIQKAFRQALLFLSASLKEPFMYDTFSEIYKMLVIDVLLPLLCDDTSVLNEFNDDPSDYYEISADLVGHRNQQSEENAAALLLETICNRIDGALVFTVQHCINTLVNSTASNENTSGRESYLKALSIISLLLEDRHDLKIQLHSLLINTQLLGHFKPHELAWYYILLQLNINETYNINPEQYTALILSTFDTPETDPTTVFVYDLILTFQKMIHHPQFYDIMFTKVPTSNSIAYFEALESMIEEGLDDEFMPGHVMVTLVEALLLKLREQMNLAEKNSREGINKADSSDLSIQRKAERLLLYKILNVLNEIARQRDYLLQHPEVIASLQVLFECLLLVELVDFEEEVVSVINLIFKLKHTLSQAEFRHLQSFQRTVKKYDTYESIFPVLGLYLTKGAEYISKYPNIATEIMRLIEAGIVSSNSDMRSQACLLYQIFLRVMHTACLPTGLLNNWKYMYNVTHERYRKYFESQCKPRLMCQLVNCWLWQLFFYNQINVDQVLESYKTCLRSSDSYNCRVFFSGLSRLLIDKIITSPDTITKFLTICIKVLESTLEEADEKNQKRRGNGISEDERMLKNPDAEIDIFKEFRTIMMALQANSNDFEQIVKRLTTETISLERLKQLSSCIIEGNQPRRYLKVNRSVYGCSEKLEQC